MKLKNILIVVRDLERSRKFYHDLFGLELLLDQDGYLIEAEAFGPRIERWLKGQGDNVKNLRVK